MRCESGVKAKWTIHANLTKVSFCDGVRNEHDDDREQAIWDGKGTTSPLHVKVEMAFGGRCLHAGDIGSKGHEGEHFLPGIWYSFHRRGD